MAVEETNELRGEGNEKEKVEEGEMEPQASIQSHPLEHSWAFWFDRPPRYSNQAARSSFVRPIYNFSTVQKFWSIYNTLDSIKLADFYCFKHNINIKLNWDDPNCVNGGKWAMRFDRGKSNTIPLLAMIGEQFDDHGDEVCGAVFTVRMKQERASIWIKNAPNEVAQVCIPTKRTTRAVPRTGTLPELYRVQSSWFMQDFLVRTMIYS